MVVAPYFKGKRGAYMKGRYNRTKWIVWIAMYLDHQVDPNRWLSVSEIADLSGMSLDYISVKIHEWVQYLYLKKHHGIGKGNHLAWKYMIAQDGKDYVLNTIPPEAFDYITKLLKEHQNKQKGG